MHLKPSLFAGRRFGRFAAGLCSVIVASTASLTAADLALNELEYLAMPGLNVMLAHDFYPESHQSGVSILQHGRRVATNGDLRLEPTPGQWQPVPKEIGEREVDPATGEIRVRMAFPDEARDRKGFNPILYPDLEFSYTVRVEPAGGSAFRIAVDLDEPLPAEWIGKVGFNLELFPGFLFGKTFLLDGVPGRFPRQANGPGSYDAEGAYQVDPLGVGRELVIAPAEAEQRLTISSRAGGPLELLDGRSEHHNGWYVVRSTIPDGATQAAVEWLVTPHVMEDWRREPVIQVSQVGYHPGQEKIAIIELDQRDAERPEIEVLRVGEDGARTVVAAGAGESFGRFLRYDYLQFDFSAVREPGLYEVRFGEQVSHPFLVASDIYQRHVWQPTVEYFLPVQMCHMQVNDRYRVWHGRCHLDDARMAPVNHNHFDGYLQGPETLTRFAPGEPVPGLDRGGWHDAGDYDLRVESQAGTMHGLALAYEEFGTDYDSTLVDQRNRLVEIHRPDGVPDLLQQIEHGALTVLGGYEALGRLYRGIIAPTLRQYTHLGDAVTQTDGIVFDPAEAEDPVPPVGLPGSPDDRWVFTEDNPRRELDVAAALAASGRVLRGYDDDLAERCHKAAVELWERTETDDPLHRVEAAVELYLSTGEARYGEFLRDHVGEITAAIENTGWIVARVVDELGDEAFAAQVGEALAAHWVELQRIEAESPYGVPYEPGIWGAGWSIQRFGMQHYFLHEAYPEIFPRETLFNALNFILGVHPGDNTESFVSGVGADSVEVAYGVNRADWSFIPGGSASGTALIRPDFPELLEWPFLWQQTEYVMGGGTTDYLLLALAAEHWLSE